MAEIFPSSRTCSCYTSFDAVDTHPASVVTMWIESVHVLNPGRPDVFARVSNAQLISFISPQGKTIVQSRTLSQSLLGGRRAQKDLGILSKLQTHPIRLWWTPVPRTPG